METTPSATISSLTVQEKIIYQNLIKAYFFLNFLIADQKGEEKLP